MNATKSTWTIAVLSCVLLCSSCSSSNSTVLAAPAPPVPVQAQTQTCTVEKFYDGPTESQDYLQFASHACLITTAGDGTPAQDVKETYTLKFAHLVQGADMQMGSNTGSNLEWAFWVDFVTPNAHSFSLFMQFDKHTDTVGNKHEWRPFTVPLALPAGTTVTIRRPMLPDAYCTKAGPYANTTGCATGQKIELVGVIN
ncbi:MAG TPA: hypothetical protein VKY85_07555 [Candidatus Angelobacter sp.]|nr:hypothetical protein [Candidatus Angelobacter sp.]